MAEGGEYSLDQQTLQQIEQIVECFERDLKIRSTQGRVSPPMTVVDGEIVGVVDIMKKKKPMSKARRRK